MNTKISWQYLAGYIDGEGSLLMGIFHDKRKDYVSEIDHYGFLPSMCIQSYDHETLKLINEFLKEEGFKRISFDIRKKRDSQTDYCSRVAINGYKNLKNFIETILPYSIVKRDQYNKFLEIYEILESRPLNRFNNKAWTKPYWIRMMKKVDELNSYKKGLRGRKWYDFFLEKWDISI